MADDDAGRPADSLVIAGLVPLSTVDWPGRLCATVFLQGCPWNCPYCHNHALIPTRVPGIVDWQEVRDLLSRRRGLLDGVVFTGGEALRQDALADAAAEVREMGFEVGLHTAGAYPRRLRDLVEAELVDWVGLDVKALPEHYEAVAGRPGSGAKAWECLDIVLAAAGDAAEDGAAGKRAGGVGSVLGGRTRPLLYEVRTTVMPHDVTADDAFEVARRCKEKGVRSYALQQARAQGTREGFVAVAPGWDSRCERLAERIEALGFDHFEYRPA